MLVNILVNFVLIYLYMGYFDFLKNNEREKWEKMKK